MHKYICHLKRSIRVPSLLFESIFIQAHAFMHIFLDLGNGMLFRYFVGDLLLCVIAGNDWTLPEPRVARNSLVDVADSNLSKESCFLFILDIPYMELSIVTVRVANLGSGGCQIASHEQLFMNRCGTWYMASLYASTKIGIWAIFYETLSSLGFWSRMYLI